MANLLVNIDVNDLEKAIQFYTHSFGLRIGRKFGNDAIELLGLEVPIYLLKKDQASLPFKGASRGRNYQRHWCPIHFDIVVQNIDDALADTLGVGAKLEEDVRTAEWGKIAILSDPFGNGFCLIEFVNSGYDEIAE
jgi:predicted enzyme related to lactoylglutathione lyase